MIDDQTQRNYDDANNYGRHAVTPYVHTLIVHHKETFENLFGSVEIYPVSMSDMLVILHILRSCMIVPNRGPTFGLKQSFLLHLALRPLFP